MVVGDSIIKKVKGWVLSNKAHLFVVKYFPGAKTADMKSYVKFTLKSKPERILIHCGNNGLKTTTAQSVADEILSLS